MALTSYTELKASIADTLNRTDLTTVIADFISLAEARIRRTVRTSAVDVSTVSIAAADDSFTLPTGALELISLSIASTTLGGPIETVSRPVLETHRRMHATAGTPTVAWVGSTTVEFSPVADQAYSVIVEYEGPFTALSGSNASNYVLASHPDAYLYGSLAESAPYLKDDERIPVWEGRFQLALQEMEIARERHRWPAPVSVPVASTFAATPPGY